MAVPRIEAFDNLPYDQQVQGGIKTITDGVQSGLQHYAETKEKAPERELNELKLKEFKSSITNNEDFTKKGMMKLAEAEWDLRNHEGRLPAVNNESLFENGKFVGRGSPPEALKELQVKKILEKNMNYLV